MTSGQREDAECSIHLWAARTALQEQSESRESSHFVSPASPWKSPVSSLPPYVTSSGVHTHKGSWTLSPGQCLSLLTGQP